MMNTRRLAPLLGLLLVAAWTLAPTAQAQTDVFDATWYDATAPYVKVDVVEDGVYQLTGQALQEAGVPLGTIDPATFRLLEGGREVPLLYEGGTTTMASADHLAFVGRRNTGADEDWLYNGELSNRSSAYNSLFTDTTTYWLTWGGSPGQRYASDPPPSLPSPTTRTTARDTLHLESDLTYYYGDSFDSGNPLYTRGEGYYWHRFRHTSDTDLTETFVAALPTPSSDAGETIEVRVQLNGETNADHEVELALLLETDTGPTVVPFDTVAWRGYAFAELTATVPQDQLPADGILEVQLTSFDTEDTAPNQVLLDWIEVAYTRELSLNDGPLAFTTSLGGDQRFTLGAEAGSYHVFIPARAQHYPLTSDGTPLTFDDPATGPATYWLTNADAYLAPASVTMDISSNLAAAGNQADYILLTSAAVRTSADEMAAYRRSAAGGSYEVMVVEVQDVFDQFDYGRPTPIALRRFVRNALSWSQAPTFLMIWGDGLYPDPQRARLAWEVPSFGNTASDGWFAMQLDGPTDYSEALAIGRIPIRTDAQGRIFIDKIDRYEAAELEAWQKRGLYLVGGKTSSEKFVLQSYATDWSTTAASAPVGLDTLQFFKATSEVLDPTFKDSLSAALQEGASWLTYFGHSAAQTWEIVTDPPREYDNAGRLPIVLSLGCFTGDFAGGSGVSSDLLTFSEQLVYETENGGIAHWGASASGTIGASGILSTEVHQSVFTDSLRVLGTALQASKSRVNDVFSDPLTVKHLLQYGLIGDPATRVSLATRPDFRLGPERISVAPIAPIPADSVLTVTVRAQNYGLVPSDSVTVQLTHQAPDGATNTFTQRIKPYARDLAVEFRVPIGDASVGTNQLTATLDPGDEYAEEDEFNNAAEQSIVVFSTGLNIAAPPPYGLVPTTSPRLLVSFAAPTAGTSDIAFELDTAPGFDSPDLQQTTVTTSRPFASWQPSGVQDGTTYYWRARVVNPEEPDNWRESVFTPRTDLALRGWYQAGALFDVNEQSPLLLLDDGEWTFNSFTVEASASSERGGGNNKGEFVINGEVYERLHLGFGLVVLNGANGEIRGTAGEPTYPNNFVDPAEGFAQLRSLADQAEPGDVVLVDTRHLATGGASVIPDSVKAIFQDLGSTAIDTLTYQDLWIMMGRVGEPMLEVVEPWVESGQEITVDSTFVFFFDEGTTTTPRVGPAKRWDTLGWNADLANASGSVTVDVLDASTEEVLLEDLEGGTADLTTIDPRLHPYLRLRATLRDTLRQATPQLKDWYIGYQRVPELALDPTTFEITADTLLEGQPGTISALLTNLSELPADSILVEYKVTNAANETFVASVDTLVNLTDETVRTYTLDTAGLVGANRLQITAEQVGVEEEATFNNVLIEPFVVVADRTPPTFEVVIDGETFPNDPDPVVNLQDPALPFVSSEPTIEITLRDENPYFALENDTTLVEVTLNGEEIPYTVLRPDGAGKRSNDVQLRFQPSLAGRDTTHTLTVSAMDASGNPAVGSPYQVHFRTQSELAVESVYPYPNPMSTQTTFAFRLRGATALDVDDFRLRIYTINGRLVREFDLTEDPSALEAGALRIGWNKLRWDGTDEDGDPVATGVYLYKVFARTGEGDLDLGNTGGVEKVVVLR